MITIKNLDYRYDKKAPLILDKISLSIGKGEFVAVIGQNGAGKTTLLKQLNGLLKPVSGNVVIDDLDTSVTKTSELARHIGYLFQNPDHQIFCNTVFEEIKFGLLNIKCKPDEIDGRIEKIATLLGLKDKLQKNPFTLSRGERQRIALASVLVLETEILVLDEPTTGQDYRECIEIMDIVRNLNDQGKTIIMVSHDIEVVADYAKRVIILQNGKISEDGETSKILHRQESLKLAGLEPPQIIKLALRFGDLFKNASTSEEMFEAVKTLSKTGRGVQG